MAEPLLYRDRLIGVLVVTHVEPGRFFLMPDREPLAVLAAQATIAIENARLFQESTQRQARLATILDINKRIATNEDMASLLAQIAEEAAHLIGADGTILRLLQWRPAGGRWATPYGPPLLMRQKRGSGRALSGGTRLENRVFMVPDVQAHPDITPYQKQRAAEAGINSLCCVSRSVVGTTSWGCCRSHQSNRRVFTDD